MDHLESNNIVNVIDQNEDQDFQIIAEDHSSSPEDLLFDQIVAALQEIIFDDSFEEIQSSFMRKHCYIFEDQQENKNQYMSIFKLYQSQIQTFVQQNLLKLVPAFSMPSFLILLQNRTDQIDEQILDTVQSFTQFEAFKKIMLEYKSYYQQEESLKALTVKSNKIG